MRPGQGISSLTTYFSGIWGGLSIVILGFTIFNAMFPIIGILSGHQGVYGLFSFCSCAFTMAIIYASRERIESYYFPARGYEEPDNTLKAAALNIWPLFLVSLTCFLIYMYEYEGMAGMPSGTAQATLRQQSILLLLPYTVSFTGFTATSALIAIKEAIRASRIAFGLDDAEVTTGDLTDRVLRPSAGTGSGSRILP